MLQTKNWESGGRKEFVGGPKKIVVQYHSMHIWI